RYLGGQDQLRGAGEWRGNVPAESDEATDSRRDRTIQLLWVARIERKPRVGTRCAGQQILLHALAQLWLEAGWSYFRTLRRRRRRIHQDNGTDLAAGFLEHTGNLDCSEPAFVDAADHDAARGPSRLNLPGVRAHHLPHTIDNRSSPVDAT